MVEGGIKREHGEDSGNNVGEAQKQKLHSPVPLLTSPVAVACVNLACTRRSTSSRSLQAEGNKSVKIGLGLSNAIQCCRRQAPPHRLPHLPQLGIGQ